MKSLLLPVVLFSVFYLSHSDKPTPPLNWPQIKNDFPYKIQSPTKFSTAKAQLTELSRLEIHFPWSSDKEMVSIENTGYYLDMLLLHHEGKQRPYLTGGPVGKNGFSTEVHLVFYNTAYGCYEELIHNPDGVAVLAIFGKISPEDNQDFEHLIHSFSKIIEPGTKTKGSFNKEFKFLDILFKQPTYYSFPGSLTTSSYSECVTWIVVPVPFDISPQQLNVFRTLKAEDDKNLRQNDRPLQDFAGRPLITPSNAEKFYFTPEITSTKSA